MDVLVSDPAPTDLVCPECGTPTRRARDRDATSPQVCPRGHAPTQPPVTYLAWLTLVVMRPGER